MYGETRANTPKSSTSDGRFGTIKTTEEGFGSIYEWVWGWYGRSVDQRILPVLRVIRIVFCLVVTTTTGGTFLAQTFEIIHPLRKIYDFRNEINGQLWEYDFFLLC